MFILTRIVKTIETVLVKLKHGCDFFFSTFTVKMIYAETAIELSFDEPLASDVSSSLKKTEGVYDSALEFDGLGTWLNLTDDLTNISCILGAPVCTSGWTLTFLFNFKGDHLEHDQYFISTPGEQGDGLGLYFRYTAQNKSLPFRRYFELGYRIESREYAVWFNLVQDQWLQLFATWSDLFGLSVYIDGKLIATDMTGSLRGVQPSSQPPQLILGRRITDPKDTYGKFVIDHLELLDYGHPVGQSFLPLIDGKFDIHVCSRKLGSWFGFEVHCSFPVILKL